MAIPKKVLAEQAAKEEARAEKDHERCAKEQCLHDKKAQESAMMFQNAKVTSCSKILQKNGQNVCLAFMNGAPKPVDLNSKRLPEVTSLSQD